jgi:hypothetical protein
MIRRRAWFLIPTGLGSVSGVIVWRVDKLTRRSWCNQVRAIDFKATLGMTLVRSSIMGQVSESCSNWR